MQFNESFEKSKAKVLALNTKAVEIAEDNTKAAFAFAREALAAKTPEAFWAVQQDYFKKQQDAAFKQAEAVSAIYAEWMKDAAVPNFADAFKPFLGKAA
jgi:hypothetical protein